MTATALIVELVLTGVVTLTVLLLPAVAAGWDPAASALGRESAIAIGLGLGFLIGVVVDRCADTLLDRWLAVARLSFAHKTRTATQRDAICALEPVTDCFPEDWMRNRLLSRASEHIVRAYEQWRVRIRITRTVTILTPAVTTSALAALWIATRTGEDARAAAILVPAYQMAGLLLFSLAARPLKATHTTQALEKPTTRDRWTWGLVSPATGWMSLQLVAAGVMLSALPPDSSRMALGVAAGGAAVTILAAGAWFRINQTLMQFVWDYCRFEQKADLAAACCA